MTRDELFQAILRKRSFLCIGLDPDPERLPPHLLEEPDPLFSFNRQIIDATHDLCVAYKPNLAFYEARGSAGWQALEKTVRHIRSKGEHLVIADAKRGDIGNTARHYARAFFHTLGADALTVAPYMGRDSVQPFLEFPGKWVVLLALTSNPGSADFQLLPTDGAPLFERVLQTAAAWGDPERLMFVVGATHPEHFARIRALVPDHFLLVPGIGAQGGDLEAVCRHGFNDRCGLLVNVSRSILYASPNEDFADAARRQALHLQKRMAELLPNRDGGIFVDR